MACANPFEGKLLVIHVDFPAAPTATIAARLCSELPPKQKLFVPVAKPVEVGLTDADSEMLIDDDGETLVDFV